MSSVMKRRPLLTPARRSSASTGNAGSQDWRSPTANAAAGTRGPAVIEVSQPRGALPSLGKARAGSTFEKRVRERDRMREVGAI